MPDGLTAAPDPSWHLTCAWCGHRFEADRPREFCGLDCHNLNRWHGGVRPLGQLRLHRPGRRVMAPPQDAA